MRRKSRRSPESRIVTSTPVVYLGPDAREALEEVHGVLLGAQRPGWVDAVCFSAAPSGAWNDLVERRFRARRSLQAVGIVLAANECRRYGRAIARELVPGDVVLAVPVNKGKGRPRAYVNQGGRLAPARLKISRAV